MAPSFIGLRFGPQHPYGGPQSSVIPVRIDEKDLRYMEKTHVIDNIRVQLRYSERFSTLSSQAEGPIYYKVKKNNTKIQKPPCFKQYPSKNTSAILKLLGLESCPSSLEQLDTRDRGPWLAWWPSVLTPIPGVLLPSAGHCRLLHALGSHKLTHIHINLKKYSFKKWFPRKTLIKLSRKLRMQILTYNLLFAQRKQQTFYKCKSPESKFLNLPSFQW